MDVGSSSAARSPVVDVHSHLYPRWYLDLLRQRREPPRVIGVLGEERFVPGPVGGWPIDEAYWCLDAKLEYMDREGIAQSVVSLANPWLDPFPPADGLALARRVNAEFAGFAAATNGRVAGLGVLPHSSVEDTLAVVAEVAADGRLYGFVSGTRICGLATDEAELDPLWAALEHAGLALFLHPGGVPGADLMGGYGSVLPVALGFPFETSIALARMSLAGVFERFNGLKLLAAHGGGTLPMLAGRLDAAHRSESQQLPPLATTPGDQLGGVFLDLVVYHRRAVTAAAALAGPDRIAFGTDHPFGIADAAANVTALAGALDGEGVRAARGGNARALFGLPPLG